MSTIVFISDEFAPEHIHFFSSKLGEKFEIHHYNKAVSLKDQIVNANVVISYGKDLTGDILSAAKDLKMVIRLGTAKGNLDTDYLDSKSIAHFNTQSPALISVAEHTMALILALSKEIIFSDKSVRSNLNPKGYSESKTDQLHYAYNWLDLNRFDCLYKKTLGIVGFGIVGQRLARIGNAMDMYVMYYSRNRLSDKREKELHVRYGSFDDVLSQSDFVSSHLILNSETLGLFNKDAFSKMKKTAYFINTSRGAVVCEKDLIEALEKGMIAGAGLDVFEVEPLPANSPLKKMQNVVLTAHSAGIQLYKSLYTEFEDGAFIIKENLH